MASYDALINLRVKGLNDLNKIDNAVNGITKGARNTTKAVKDSNKVLMTQGLRLRALAKSQNTLIEKMHRRKGKDASFLLPDSKMLNASARGIKRHFSEQQAHARHINKVQQATLNVEKRRVKLNRDLTNHNKISARIGKNIRAAKAAAHREEIRTLQQIINLRTLADRAGGIGARLGALDAPAQLNTRGRGGKMLALPSAEMRANLPGAFQNAPGFRGTKAGPKGSGALQSALISGAFPLLFGQGPLGGAAGFAGGFIGTKMGGQMGGFAGGLVATAALQSITQAITGISNLGQALNPFTADIGKLTQALGIAGTAEGARLQAIEALSGKQAALAEATRLMNQQLGIAGTETLKVFGEKMKGVGNEFSKLMTKLGAVFAKLILDTGILDFLQGILSFVNNIDMNKFKGLSQMFLGLASFDLRGFQQGVKTFNTPSEKDPTLKMDVVGSRNLFGKTFENQEEKIKFLNDVLRVGKEKAELLKLEREEVKKIEDATGETFDLNDASNKANLTKVKSNAELANVMERQVALAEQLKSTLSEGIATAIEGLITGAKSLQESFSSILKSFGSILLRAGISNMMGGLNFGSFFGKGVVSAQGNYISNGIRPFATGGMATKPTIGLVGEAGEDEYIIPASKMSTAMQRYSSGVRGQSVIPGTGSSQSGGGGGASTTVNYSGPVLTFNSEEFVPKSAVGEIIATATSQGAKAGENRTLSTLRNNRSARSRIGM